MGSSSTASINVVTTAKDVAGNSATCAAAVLVDNTLPVLSNLTPKYKLNQWWAADGDSIYFVATATDSGAVSGLSSVTLDASAIGGPSSVTMLDDGKGNDAKAGDGNYSSASVVVATGSATRFFTFQVTAIDNASNSAFQSGNVYIDNGRPLYMNVTAPISGQFVEGMLTCRVQATDLPAIEKIEVTLNPGGTYRTAYNALTGYFEYVYDSVAVADGTYYICATGRDIAGKPFVTPSTIQFYIDNHAPVLKLNSPRNGDYLSGVVAFNITGTSDLFLSAVAYNVDGTGWVAIDIPWNTSNVSDGMHTVVVRAVDRAGHYVEQTIKVTVDNTNPTCRIITPGKDDILEGKVTFSVKASDTVGVAGVTLFDAVSAEAEYNFLSGYFEYTFDTRDLADGNYTLNASARDEFGYVTQANGVSFRIDNHAPALTIVEPYAYSYVSGSVLVQLNTTDGPFTPELLVEYKVDERSWVRMMGPGPLWTDLWNTSQFSDGLHTITVRSTDISGKQVQQSLQLTVDNHDPVCQIYAPLPNQYCEGRQLFQVLAQDEVGIVNVTLTIGSVGSFLMSFNGYTGYYEYALLSTKLADGAYNASVKALDRSGRQAVAGPLLFNIANTAPKFVLLKPHEGDAITDTIVVEIAWVTGRAAPLNATVRYKIDNGAWIPAEQNTSASTLADGTHTITVRAEDPAGHSTELSVSIFIDKNFPTVSVLSPKSGIHTKDAVPLKLKVKDEAGVHNVTMAIDNSTPEELYLNTATGFYEYSLDLFGLPDGAHQAYIAAFDLAGHPTYANFSVYLDTTGPSVSLEQPALTGDKSGPIKFTVASGDPSDVKSVAIRLKGGDLREMMRDQAGNYRYTWDTTVADDGTHSVEIVATDRLGNEASHSYELTVRNKVPNFLEDNFSWLLLLVLIIGFVMITIATVAVFRRLRHPLQYQAVDVIGKPRQPQQPIIPAGPKAVEVQEEEVAFQDDGEETAFQDDEETGFEDAEPEPHKPAQPAAPAAAAQGQRSPPSFSAPLRISQPASPPAGQQPRGLASMLGLKSPAPAPTPAPPPAARAPLVSAPKDEGFVEVAEEGGVEEVRMEAWMPRGSLPAAQEMPKPASSGPKPYVPPGVAAAQHTDMWEEEDEVGFEDEVPPKPALPSAKPSISSPFVPRTKGVSPLDALMLSNLKVTRSENEKKAPPKSQPLGWTHARPAEVLKEQEAQRAATSTQPQQPARPRSSEELYAPPSAVRNVPPTAQPSGKRDKMGSVLDDLLASSRKK